MAKDTIFLIETSAVRACLESSTRPHEKHFNDATRGGELRSSIYIRKEVIVRWVCDDIRIACAIAQCGTVDDAMVVLEQDFSPRNVKGVLARIAKFLRDNGNLENTRLCAEEMASQAFRSLRAFDRRFPSMINNSVGCEIGGVQPKIDFNYLLTEAQEFCASVRSPVQNCRINRFLRLGKEHSRAMGLIEDAKASRLPVVQQLADFHDKGTWITCRECAKIGDAVIAIEQPRSTCLVHVDNSFNALCLDKPHLQLKSVMAVHRAQLPGANPPPPNPG